MYIARILYPVEVLGPGKRIGIWVSGCHHRCRGCSNPELWQRQESQRISIENIMALIRKIAENQVDGFTITGGDPMEQADELAVLLRELKTVSEDILVYTGFEIEELDARYLQNISVLIDGKYKEELNDNVMLRGSSNQRIHILEKTQKNKYESYLSIETNKIQNFFTKDGTVSVGIHKPDFMKEEN